jgi:peptidoglycan/LPS O-acetylase OafA/YrhL
VRAQDPRFPLFDSLRAIAALTVVAYHLAFFTGHFGRFAAQLNIGVPIFFLISAFLLYRPFVRARFSDDPPPATGRYAVRRLLRIVPAYWVMVIVGGFVLSLPVVDSFSKILPYLTFTQVYSNTTLFGGDGLGHAWTLCVEITFYILLPIWAFAVRRLPELPALAAMFLAGVAWNLFVVDYVGGFAQISWKVATLPGYLDQFAIGMALAVVSVKQPDLHIPPARLCWGAALAGYVVVCLIATHPGRLAALATHELRALVGLALLLPAVYETDRVEPVRRVLAQPWLLWVGTVSYGLYLWHPPIMRKLLDAGMSGVPYALVSVTLSLGAAAASWYIVERNVIKLGHRR